MANDSTINGVEPLVREFHEKIDLSIDFCGPYFEAGVRLYKLFRGKLPDALNGTFSKVMLNAAHASVQDRIPKYLANLFAQKVTVEARDPMSEFLKDDAQNWLQHLMYSTEGLNMEASLVPALQAASVFGTAYRMPCIRHVPNEDGTYREVVTSMDADFFSILPAAQEGGLVNPINSDDDAAIPYFFHIDWLTDDQIEGRFAKYPGFKKDAFAKLKDTAISSDTTLDQSYYEKYRVIAGVSYGQSAADYRRKMQDVEGKGGKRRVIYWFGRNYMRLIVQDYFLVYDGPNPIGGGILPLVKYCVTPDFTNWFGISGLEMAEDIIIARIMNLNFRLDHLARVMFPTKWIRTDVAEGHDESYFNDRPYAVHFFPDRVNIKEAIHYDRAPEVTNQTFIEDDRMMLYIQEVLGLPNYSKGMSGAGTLANETASGILSLIKQAQGRMGMESMQLEYTGLAQEARLLLLMAGKAVRGMTRVRVPEAQDGFKWTTVDPIAFQGQFSIKTHGTRYIEQQEQSFQKLLALYPLWNNKPGIEQTGLDKFAAEATGIPDFGKIVLPPAPMVQPPEMAGAAMGEPGGLASQQNVRNPARSVQNRNTVAPDTGAVVPAGFGM